MQDKKALQAGTSHHLGQNFAKVFNIRFQDRKGDLRYVEQTSWGVSTRLIGALIMVHGDDSGLIIPPKLATNPVVAIPIFKDSKTKKDTVGELKKLKDKLKNEVPIQIDDREQYKPGWKFNEWELLGTPLRVEIGPKDVEKSQCVLARRDTGEKEAVPLKNAPDVIKKQLDLIQKSLFAKAKKFMHDNTQKIDKYDDFKKVMEKNEGFTLSHWCGHANCESQVKDDTKATIRCIPEDAKKEAGKCMVCGNKSEKRVVFAKAY